MTSLFHVSILSTFRQDKGRFCLQYFFLQPARTESSFILTLLHWWFDPEIQSTNSEQPFKFPSTVTFSHSHTPTRIGTSVNKGPCLFDSRTLVPHCLKTHSIHVLSYSPALSTWDRGGEEECTSGHPHCLKAPSSTEWLITALVFLSRREKWVESDAFFF